MKHFLYHAVRAMTRHYPLDTPRARLLRVLPDVPAEFGPISGKHGVTYTQYPSGSDHIAKCLFWFGDFDPWVVRTMRRLTRTGEVVCDVGANLGDTALPLARRVGPSGRVYCFEPVPISIGRLRENIEANRHQQLTVLPVALSDTTGTIDMVVPDGQPGMASVGRTVASATSVQVETVRFDDWLVEASIDRVSVFKLDVEGHELSVLRGMPDALAAGRVGAFVFEHHQVLDSHDELATLFVKHGYRVYRIHKGLRSTSYVPVSDACSSRPTSDYVAVRPGSESECRLLGRAEAS